MCFHFSMKILEIKHFATFRENLKRINLETWGKTENNVKWFNELK